MAPSMREVVAELAGPRAVLRERPAPPDWTGNVVAEVELSKPVPVLPGTTFVAGGDTAEAAWTRIAYGLAAYRLTESVKAAGWDHIEEVVDETTYVVARDPEETLWAIGIASTGSDRREYIERDMSFDERAFGRIAFIEPLDARDSVALFAALGASD